MADPPGVRLDASGFEHIRARVGLGLRVVVGRLLLGLQSCEEDCYRCEEQVNIGLSLVSCSEREAC